MKRTVIALGLLLATSQALAAGATTNTPTHVPTTSAGHGRNDTVRHKDHVIKAVEFWLRKILKDR